VESEKQGDEKEQPNKKCFLSPQFLEEENTHTQTNPNANFLAQPSEIHTRPKELKKKKKGKQEMSLFCFFVFLKKKNDEKKRGKKRRTRSPPYASGRRSMLYCLEAMYMMGIPGIFRILRFRSLSQVATM